MHQPSVRSFARSFSPRPSAAFALLAVLGLGASASAQRTWIVDASNGAGTDFTDLPPAFAAVADGDRVLVRTGSYTSGRLDKAVRLVADPGAVVMMARDDFEIAGIGDGETCIVHGLAFRYPGPFFVGGSISAHDNAGLIVLSGLDVELENSSPALEFVNTRGATLTDCLVRSYLYVQDSEVSAARCTFRAFDLPVSYGIFAFRAQLELSQCSAFGTNGSGHAPSAPAIRMHSSALVLRGDALSRYVGGTYAGQQSSPSIDGSGTSTLVVDPAIVLTPPPIGLTSITTRRMGSLTAQIGPLGGSLDLELYSPAGDLYALFVALPTTPFDFPPFGRQWMDIPSEFFVLGGLQDASEHARFPIPVPNVPGLRGLALAFQALTGPPARLEVTNPVVPVVH